MIIIFLRFHYLLDLILLKKFHFINLYCLVKVNRTTKEYELGRFK